MTALHFLSEDVLSLLMRLALDAVVASILVQGFYVRRSMASDFGFTGYIFNLITFCLCAVLQKIPVEIGFALGLFGVFGILRYRTEAMSSRDLTYLFALIGLAMINALVDLSKNLDVVLVVDAVLVCGVGILDRPSAVVKRIPIIYDRLELLAHARRTELLADIAARIGREVASVEVEKVDLLQDSVVLHVELRPS